MYRGDGSYRDHKIEVSLLELLKAEQENINELNNARRAYELSRRSSGKCGGYLKDIECAEEKLKETRNEIHEYIQSKLLGKDECGEYKDGITTGMASLLYNN